MSTPKTRRKPGPKPLSTSFLLEDLVADVNSRVIANTHTVECSTIGEAIFFDRKDTTFADRLTEFLMRAARSGVIRSDEVTAWAAYLLDEAKVGSGRRKAAADRTRKVYGWARYDFEAY